MRGKCSNCGECDTLFENAQICFECHCLNNRIKMQCRIARQKGLSDDLTLAQWMQTVRYFNGHCAYCDKKPEYLLIEHFIPVSSGGGTTFYNCIPACGICNARKRDLLPQDVKLIPSEAIEHVYEYLENLKTGTPNS